MSGGRCVINEVGICQVYILILGIHLITRTNSWFGGMRKLLDGSSLDKGKRNDGKGDVHNHAEYEMSRKFPTVKLIVRGCVLTAKVGGMPTGLRD